MANKHAALKAIRQNEKQNARNSAVKLGVKQHVKAVRKALEANEYAKAAEALKKAIKVIDKAGQNKVIKKNAAARKKSRLTLAVQKAKK